MTRNNKKNRILILTFFLACFAPAVHGENDLFAITHGPYIQNLTENSVTIMWFTNENAVSSVEYGTGENLNTFPQFGSLVKTAVSSTRGLIAANTRNHKIILSDLEPGQTYRYRVVSKHIVQFQPYEVIYGATAFSDIFTFKTLDRHQEKTSFLVVNDIHENAERLQQQMSSVSWENIDMVFLNGDTISHFEEEQQIFNGFLDVCVESFARRLPFILVRGNHETRGAMARQLSDYVALKNDRFYYSFNQGPVHFIVLDTGEDKPDTHPVYAGLADFDRYRDAQADWLREDSQTKDFSASAFQIVICHIPPYSGAAEDRIGHGEHYIRSAWGPLFNTMGIDLLICGHTHRFRIFESDTIHSYPVLISGQDTIVQVFAQQDELTVTVLNNDGSLRDSFKVLKDVSQTP